MQQTETRTPGAAAQARHRQGVATQLREIKSTLPEILAEVRAIRREVDAHLAGLVDSVVNEKRDTPQ